MSSDSSSTDRFRRETADSRLQMARSAYGKHHSALRRGRRRGTGAAMVVVRCVIRWGVGFSAAILALAAASGAFAARQDAADNNALAARIDEAFTGDPRVAQRSGLCIVTLPDGEDIYRSPRANDAFIPASNQKLLISAAALDRLGPDFRWTTRLALRGNDLVLVGSGDPATGDPVLSEAAAEPITAIFHRWADALKEAGVTRVTGDLVVDTSAFDDQFFHPHWSDRDRYRWYGAPVGGLNFNDNCIDVTLLPGPQPGAPTRVHCVPATTLVEIINRSNTAASGVPIIARRGMTNTFVITGSCGRRAELTSAPVVDPPLFFASACRTSLAASGIQIVGTIRRETVRQTQDRLPPECDLIATHTTPLRSILPRMNKRSQNLFAECLLKTLGRYAEPERLQTGTWTAGAKVVRESLVEIVREPAGLVIDDGSGLSRHNRVSPRQLIDVLTYMYRHPHGDLFIASLAVAGADGTLEKRQGMRSIRGQVRAKTGYISGVRSLSGYVQADSGRWFAFAFLFNDPDRSVGTYRATRLQDRICRILAGG